MTLLALLIGLLITALGLLGLATPTAFVRSVAVFQTPPVIYLAAAVRVAFGVVLLRASASRAARVLRVLGFLILIGGLLTPFVGGRAAHLILEWWSVRGPGLVRVWAGAAMAIGLFIVYAVAPSRRAA